MTTVALDSSFLITMVEPDVEAGTAAGGLSTAEVKARLAHLWAEMSKAKTRIILPAPVLAEAMVRRPEQMARFIDRLRSGNRVQIEPFGAAAAMETAALFREHWPNPKIRKATLTKSGLKFDLQILACAKVAGCDRLYTTDPGLIALATRAKLPVSSIQDLPSPKDRMETLFERAEQSEGQPPAGPPPQAPSSPEEAPPGV